MNTAQIQTYTYIINSMSKWTTADLNELMVVILITPEESELKKIAQEYINLIF